MTTYGEKPTLTDAEKVVKLRELHALFTISTHRGPQDICAECAEDYPCDTTLILDNETL